MSSEQDNGAAGRQAPRPAGTTAPKDTQWFWDTEDAQVALSRLRSLQSAKDKAQAELVKARNDLRQAQRRAVEAEDNLRAEINRELRPKIAYPPREQNPPVDAAEASTQANFAPEREPEPPKKPPQLAAGTQPPKKEKKPRKPRKQPEQPTDGPMNDQQRGWFCQLRRTNGHAVLPLDVAGALIKRGLCNKCPCADCSKDGQTRYVYGEPSALLVPAVASATGPTAPDRAGEVEGWVILDGREGGRCPQWDTRYPDLECARIAIEAALGLGDREGMAFKGPPIPVPGVGAGDA